MRRGGGVFNDGGDKMLDADEGMLTSQARDVTPGDADVLEQILHVKQYEKVKKEKKTNKNPDPPFSAQQRESDYMS